jgi:aromatic-L-amino-acid/L-tryptophan decarboxylase
VEGSTPEIGERRPALADREAVLSALTTLISEAWESFERPRPEEPALRDDVRARLTEGLPRSPSDPREVLADAAEVLDESNSPARPLYLGYIGSTGLEVGVLAAALAATYDVNLAVTARAADLLESQAVRWVSEFVGYPCAEGAFTSGGMISNLTAMLVARERALPGCRTRGFEGRRAAAYCSEEAHHSVIRAAEAAGLGSDWVRSIRLDGRRRIDPAALDAAIARDAQDGITPVAVVANGGTTLTGAVDPLDEVGAVCERHGVWMHVDGAYGLPAAATDAARGLFAGLGRADSVTLDAHKWMGLQKSCSVVLVRDAGLLEEAFGHEGAYIRRDSVVRNAVERTLEYSRPLRSLKLWLAFRTYGADQFRAWIETTLARARQLADEVSAEDEFELAVEPTLSTVCFRHAPAGMPPDELDAHNTRLAAAAQDDGRVYIASAIVDGSVWLRACFVNFRTRASDVTQALDAIRELGRELASA